MAQDAQRGPSFARTLTKAYCCTDHVRGKDTLRERILAEAEKENHSKCNAREDDADGRTGMQHTMCLLDCLGEGLDCTHTHTQYIIDCREIEIDRSSAPSDAHHRYAKWHQPRTQTCIYRCFEIAIIILCSKRFKKYALTPPRINKMCR